MNGIYILEFVPFVIGIVLSLTIQSRMRIYTSSGMFFSNPDDIMDKHKSGVVEIGGVAFFPIIMMSLCLSLGVSSWLEYMEVSNIDLGITGDRILQVISGCALLYIVGLKSDIHGTFGKTKRLALFAAVTMFPASGLWIHSLDGLFGIYDLSPWVGIPLTILLAASLTEMIVLLDDMDGFGIGVLTIMLGIFCLYSLVLGFTLGILVTAASLGLCIPYAIMKYFSPSWKKLLIGNAGTYPLGYLLSYAALSLVHPAGIECPPGMLLIILAVVLVPAFDLLRTIRGRVQEGRSIHTPDRNLLQHRLMRLGVKTSLTPLVIFLLIFACAGVNTFCVLQDVDITFLFIADMLVLTVLQVGANTLIKKREDQKSKTSWVTTYGREAWEADIPVDKIQRKRKLYGDMGLAAKYILGDETEFIPDGMNAFERNTKRAIDCVVSIVLLILTSPLFLFCYLIIKLSDGGPVIYKQERIGRFGQPFVIYKFRSMRTDAEKDGPALSHKSGEDDPRLTIVGKFLRAHHLDELPQLWNVFRGDMAFVGYRPERKYYIDQIVELDPRYTMLYQIRPGVTSYATLYNGYTDNIEKMLRRLNYDLYYLEHRSFGFDLKVLGLTFISIIFGKKF